MTDTPNPAGIVVPPAEIPTTESVITPQKPNNVEALERKNAEILGEKRRAQEALIEAQNQLAKYQDADKAAEENKLIDAKKFDELNTLRQKELETAQAEVGKYKQEREDSMKLSALLASLPGNVSEQYWGLFDLSQILLDPTTGSVDPASVTAVADNVTRQYPDIIAKKQGNNFPAANYPESNGGLSPDQWSKLSPAEQKARMSEVSVPEDTKWLFGQRV